MGIQNYDVFVCFFRHLDIEPVGGLGLFSLVGTGYRIEKLVTLLPAYSTVSELVQRIVAVNARDIVLIVENQVLGVCGLVCLSASDDIVVFSSRIIVLDGAVRNVVAENRILLRQWTELEDDLCPRRCGSRLGCKLENAFLGIGISGSFFSQILDLQYVRGARFQSGKRCIRILDSFGIEAGLRSILCCDVVAELDRKSVV